MPILELLSILAAIAAIFGWISVRWLRLPLTIGTVLLTVASALVLEAISAQAPGLHAAAIRVVRSIDFEALILHGMLSLLLFAGAFLLDIKELYREKLAVSVLAVGGTILSTAAVTVIMYGSLHLLGLQPTWFSCMFFGALVSPTDPIAVLEMLRRVGAPAHLQAQLAGESLFNDGIGAVIFLTVLAASRGQTPSAAAVGGLLLLEVGGAILLGIGLAWVTSWIMRSVQSYQVELLLTLSLALGGYALADRFGASAPLEAVVAGIALRWFDISSHEGLTESHLIDHFWEIMDGVLNAVLFVLLGLEVLAISFRHTYFWTGAIAIVATIVVRALMLLALLALITLLRKLLHKRRDQQNHSTDIGHANSVAVLAWGGLRGGLSLALALAVPRTPDNLWILPTTYFVVVFSIVVQGWSMDKFLQRFRNEKSSEA